MIDKKKYTETEHNYIQPFRSGSALKSNVEEEGDYEKNVKDGKE